MLFNSYIYILLFLPGTVVIYFWLQKMEKHALSLYWLIIASLFFYGWWNINYLPLILTSLTFNFLCGSFLIKQNRIHMLKRKLLLATGITFNIALIGYFKYADFLIENFNLVAQTQFNLLRVILPLGISFYTFEQIAYLVDCYKGKASLYSSPKYTVFVVFFPQLIAGPIVHHHEMVPQFESVKNRFLNFRNINKGLLLFSIGLFKKVVIADSFSIWVNRGFDSGEPLTFFAAWVTSLSYTFQLYFDFCGYTDMAIGAALLFNINLTVNFNSPYKTTNIQNFWKCWHISLSRFLKEYLYIPFGGNRFGELCAYRNILITFLIGGIWHGAGWLYLLWGFLHGMALVFCRMWSELNLKLNHTLAWVINFNFINITWVVFRANEWNDAKRVLRGMLGLEGIMLPPRFSEKLSFLKDWGVEFGHWGYPHSPVEIRSAFIFIVASIVITLFFKNSNQIAENFQPTPSSLLLALSLFVLSFLGLNSNSEFLYFNF
jgi:alginate O-acetyltransferase complex protein AlgI